VGPSIAVDARNRVHVVWPTLLAAEAGREPTLGLFYASSSDGRTFSPRQRIPTDGLPHHPQIAWSQGGVLTVVWDELKAGTRRVAAAQRSADAPAAPFARRTLSSDAPASYPAIAPVPGGVVVAWTSGGPAPSVIRLGQLPAPGEAGQ
jgi:hypothetical protein